MNEIITAALTISAIGIVWMLCRYWRTCRPDSPFTKNDLLEMEGRINMKLSELNAALEAVNGTLEKVQAEVQALKDTLKDVELPADAQASLDRLTNLAKAIDEINPDAT